MKNLINKEINTQSSKKVTSSKFLKTCLVGCLATCLTLTGIFAFAPLGASAQASSNNQNASLNNNINNSTTRTTESTGLITPRSDDPILFTTESGLEIKFGKTIIQEGEIISGGLTGFPYFRTTKNSKNYDWVIIGSRYNEFLRTGYDDAEKAILQDLCSMYEIQFPAEEKNIKHEEIPEGCYLVLANVPYGSVVPEIWYNGSKGPTNTSLDSYYNNDEFGLGVLINKVLAINIITAVPTSVTTINKHFFCLDSRKYSTANFIYSDYLTQEQFACGKTFAGRCTNVNNNHGVQYFSETGSWTRTTTSSPSCGIRTAFILQWR